MSWTYSSLSYLPQTAIHVPYMIPAFLDKDQQLASENYVTNGFPRVQCISLYIIRVDGGEERRRLLPASGHTWPPRGHCCKAEPQRVNTSKDRHGLYVERREWRSVLDNRRWQAYFFCHAASHHDTPVYSRVLLHLFTPLTYNFITSLWCRRRQTWSDGLRNTYAQYVDDLCGIQWITAVVSRAEAPAHVW